MAKKKPARKARLFYIGLYRGSVMSAAFSEEAARRKVGISCWKDAEVIRVREVLPRKKARKPHA